MPEMVYYVDSAALGEGNRELAELGCEECPNKSCKDGKSRNLWRLLSEEDFAKFAARAFKEQWNFRAFVGKAREDKPSELRWDRVHQLIGKYEERRSSPAPKPRRTPLHILRREARSLIPHAAR